MSQATASDGSVRAILSRTGRLVGENPLTLGLGVVGAVALFVPYVGPFLTVLVGGVLVEVFARDLGITSRDRSVLVRAISLLLGSAVVAVIVALGTLLVIVPGIYVALGSALTWPAIVVDSKGPLDARSESASRMRGKRIRVLAVFGGLSLLVVPAALVHIAVTLPSAAVAALFVFVCGVVYSSGTAAVVVMYVSFAPGKARSGGRGAADESDIGEGRLLGLLWHH
ncbi:hypothetical protein [Halococcoides cellulosivorans]|uniref:Glycerophosphoryl diester phosphodiesterase membrane domain-containing protein n=1 Tax=Halococcoides cellulosivorans TaxID=1679096 RepID=A0A2R4WXR0_9EURY|nr:hypothetical protein [Halococcoides cellulosivorans]AWB26332.1 hypothetical protein HARCEL1_00645 [Halococcoides cellulosivorans]